MEMGIKLSRAGAGNDEIDKTLRERGLDPTMPFIVPKKITWVPSEDLTIIEIVQFVSSVLMLFAGIFLGVMTNPQIGSPTYEIFMTSGICLLVSGILVFILGFHRQVRKWEKERIPLSVVR